MIFFLSVVQLRAVPGLGYGIKLRAVSSALHHDRQDVRVDTVDASSPAHGLLSPGDIITHVNGVPHATLRSMMAAIATSQASMHVTFLSPLLPAQLAAAVPGSSVGQPAVQRQPQQFTSQLSQQQLLQQQQSLLAQQQAVMTPAAQTSFSPAGVSSRNPASMGVPALPPPVASPRGHAIYATPSLSPHRYGQPVSDAVVGDAGAALSTQRQPPRPVVVTRASIVGEPSGGGGAGDAVSLTSAAALSSEDPRNPQAAAALASSERPRRAPAGSFIGAATPAGGAAQLDATSGRTAGFGPADASALGVGAPSSPMPVSQWSTPAAAAVRAGVSTASQSVPVPTAATPVPRTPATPGPTVLHYATPAPSPFPAPGNAIGMARPPAPMHAVDFTGSAATINGTGRAVPQVVPRGGGTASWGAPPGSFQTPQTGPPQVEPAQATGIALGAAAAGEVSCH